MPSAYRHDDHGQLRIVVARPVRFSEMADSAFDLIRQYARSSVAVTLRLLEAITLVAQWVQREEDRAALFNQALMIERGSHDGIPEERDRQKVQERFRQAVLVLQECRREVTSRSAVG